MNGARQKLAQIPTFDPVRGILGPALFVAHLGKGGRGFERNKSFSSPFRGLGGSKGARG